MRQASDARRDAEAVAGAPEPERLDHGLWVLPMPMPSSFLSYSLAVVHVDFLGAVTVVDPGWQGEEAMTRLREFLASIDREIGHIESIIVTHAHPDHIGIAEAVREESGARLFLHAREQLSIDIARTSGPEETERRMRRWGLSADAADDLRDRLAAEPPASIDFVRADELVDDGDLLPVRGARWRVILTPGHTPGHICIADKNRRILFTGDHVLPTIFPGLGLGAGFLDNPADAYLRSLQRLEAYDDFEVVPGHGRRFHGLRERRAEATSHVLRRAREVAAIVSREPDATTWDVASSLTWTGGWAQLSGSAMLYPALSQTEMYREFVQAGGLASHGGAPR